jgi:hypothetical protein
MTSPDFIQSGTLRLWCETGPSDADNPNGHRQGTRFSCRDRTGRHCWPGLGLAGGAAPLSQPPAWCVCRAKARARCLAPNSPGAAGAHGPVRREPQAWEVDTVPLERPIKQLSDLHYLAAFGGDDLEPGGDFLFWYWFTQSLKQRLLRDQYLPALRYRQPPKPKGKRKLPAPEFYGAWQWAVGDDDPLISEAVERMPAACAAGLSASPECAKQTPTRRLIRAREPAAALRRGAARPVGPTDQMARDVPKARRPYPARALPRAHTRCRPLDAFRAGARGRTGATAPVAGMARAHPRQRAERGLPLGLSARGAADGRRQRPQQRSRTTATRTIGACTSSPSPRMIPRTTCRWRTTGPQPNQNAPSIAPASAPTSSNTCC